MPLKTRTTIHGVKTVIRNLTKLLSIYWASAMCQTLVSARHYLILTTTLVTAIIPILQREELQSGVIYPVSPRVGQRDQGEAGNELKDSNGLTSFNQV